MRTHRTKHGRPRTTHGMTHTPEFATWQRMINRCRYLHHRPNRRHAGRGIRVCERWLGENGFVNFLADMGPKPSPQHSLDRINNDGNYEPGNCRWATRSQQQRNTSYNRIIVYDGLALCTQEWQERTGIPRARIEQRLRRGWSVARALTEPVTPKPRRRR